MIFFYILKRLEEKKKEGNKEKKALGQKVQQTVCEPESLKYLLSVSFIQKVC